MQLLVNVDHVATLRNARGEGYPHPTEAAKICEQAGASGIVFHLREDRRHIKDDDVRELARIIQGTIDMEMAATDEMIAICKEIQPHLCTLVPEKREELTTEGGLNMKALKSEYENRIMPAFADTNIQISLFLDPNITDIDIAAQIGADAVELHTGTYANASDESGQQQELKRLRKAAERAHELGMVVNAGHGLNRENLPELLETVPYLNDVSIGHALISDALFMGLEQTVQAYLDIMQPYQD
ncbi:MAG: pyridoxine 5'-phosphate synthase [Bacteroidota bacterium]